MKSTDKDLIVPKRERERGREGERREGEHVRKKYTCNRCMSAYMYMHMYMHL